MRRAARLIVPLLLAAAAPARALEPTPMGAGTLPRGRVGVAGVLGFPWVAVSAGYGLAEGLDATAAVRSAWTNMTRLGADVRWRLMQRGPGAFALGAGLDAWLARPAADRARWLDLTGQQDFALNLKATYSWKTSRGAVMSLGFLTQVVASLDPPSAGPLQGEPPAVGFGPNVGLRMSAEFPAAETLFVGFDLGMDLHLTGFDEALAMPAFHIGVGTVL